MKYLQKYYKFNEDVQIDTSNLQRLKDHFAPYLGDMSSKYNKDIEQIFNDDFINTISNLCLELDDLGYQVSIRFPQYHKERQGQFAETIPCLCVDIDSLSNFISNKAIEMTVKEIQSYVSDFGLSVDIELGSDDQFVTADEFINQYNVEEFDFISILIY